MWGLFGGVLLVLLEWRIKKYPFSFRNVRTYIVILIYILVGAIVVDTFKTFYTITFEPKSIGLCYNNCNEYWIYILTGSVVLLFLEVGSLVLHYANINFKRLVGKLIEET